MFILGLLQFSIIYLSIPDSRPWPGSSNRMRSRPIDTPVLGPLIALDDKWGVPSGGQETSYDTTRTTAATRPPNHHWHVIQRLVDVSTQNLRSTLLLVQLMEDLFTRTVVFSESSPITGEINGRRGYLYSPPRQ